MEDTTTTTTTAAEGDDGGIEGEAVRRDERRDEMVIVGRRGSFIPIGESLRQAAEKVNQRAVRDRIKRLGDDYKVNVGLATVHVMEGGSVLDFGDADGMGGNGFVTGESNDPNAMKDELRASIFRETGQSAGGQSGVKTGMNANRQTRAQVKEFSAETFISESISKLNVNRILITKRKDEIVREKSKKLDLKERERVVNNIMRLEREISEIVLETQKLTMERQPLAQRFDQVRKEHDAPKRFSWFQVDDGIAGIAADRRPIPQLHLARAQLRSRLSAVNSLQRWPWMAEEKKHHHCHPAAVEQERRGGTAAVR
ncbi:hypothetical protein HDU67_001724 [Dinochytrium kinnereticum]|nr:hypothetical protein HDU67_001724 [Dinochytrium kinnereticum]